MTEGSTRRPYRASGPGSDPPPHAVSLPWPRVPRTSSGSSERIKHVVVLPPRRGDGTEVLAAAALAAREHHARLTVLFAPAGLGLPLFYEGIARVLAPDTRAFEDQRELATALAAVPDDLPVSLRYVRGSLPAALVRLARADPCQLVIAPSGRKWSLKCAALLYRIFA